MGMDYTMVNTQYTMGYALPPYYHILINTRDYKYVALMPLLQGTGNHITTISPIYTVRVHTLIIPRALVSI